MFFIVQDNEPADRNFIMDLGVFIVVNIRG